ncbi:tail fiber assembly protein [Kluyvera sp. STS39-E]|uniref:tail fiber assembly protein n=1 Tax=Kluyvera sp. STS39-E TaxID=3234748 RepID=UPI0034C65124
MKTIYVNQKNNRDWSTSASAFGGLNYPAIVPDDFTGGAMTHNRFTDEWTPDPVYLRTHVDDVKDAEAIRDQLISEANEVIYDWAIDANTGDISGEDLAKLKAWRTYIKALKAMDLSAAPGIEWPLNPDA